MGRKAIVAAAVLSLTAAACSTTAGGDGLSVVVTTTPLGDVVRQVAGSDADVQVLLPIGADAHSYQLSSRQAASIRDADLVVAVGLGLEESLHDVLEAASADGANVIEVAPLLDPLPFDGSECLLDEHDEDEEGSGNGAGHDHATGCDPHVWLDPLRMAEAAHIVAARLAALDSGVDWESRADAYAAALAATDTEVRSILAAVVPERRLLVTNHEALGYFASRYGFEVVGVVIPGGSTLADPSSADLAHLVDTIEAAGVPAIFAETSQPTALASAVASEVGDDVAVVELYTESLGEPGSDAETLAGMLVTDARLIADALSG